MILTKYAERLYEQFIAELENIAAEHEDGLKARELSIWACVRNIQRLKDFFKENRPKDDQEEIDFFRYVKPKFKARLLYHQALYNIECRQPAAGTELLTQFYKKELQMTGQYYEANAAFCQYLRSGSGHLDELYFLRGRFDIHLHPFEGFVDFDPEFNTSHDNKAAQVMANEQIIVKLESLVYQLNNPLAKPATTGNDHESTSWTQTKSAMIELIYGLHETRAIENGNITLKKLAGIFERAFNISLGNFYDTFDWIASRSNQTTYLDELKQGLLARIQKKFR